LGYVTLRKTSQTHLDASSGARDEKSISISQEDLTTSQPWKAVVTEAGLTDVATPSIVTTEHLTQHPAMNGASTSFEPARSFSHYTKITER
jgi:hypothetical protein